VQLLPELGHRDPIPNYYHGQLAVSDQSDPLFTFGYASVGPIMYGFADFIVREAAAIRAQGRELKVAFLLRDGFLPSKACNALAGGVVGADLNISRFTAIAASLADRAAIVRQLARKLSHAAFLPLLKQFLLPQALCDKIMAAVGRAAEPEKAFAAQVLQPATVQVIVAASRKFRQRLVNHVRLRTGVQSGDCLMFVDLGYAGTAQTMLQDVFKEDLNVDLVGRYLLLDQVAPRQGERKGLFDASESDGRIVHALSGGYIAGFEMLCTQDMPSTVDYTEEGEPRYSSATLGAEQQTRVGLIQDACLRFIGDMRACAPGYRPKPDARQMAQSVLIDLARLLYLPTQMELDCMRSFQFDFNLGTDTNLVLFDPEQGLQAMRTHGLAYMNAGLDEMRTNYAWELRSLDLSLSTLLFAQNRFGFGVQPANASYRKETLQLLVANASEHAVHEVTASATHDGYFSLLVPVSARFNVGVLFGARYAAIQIASVQLVDDDLLRGQDMVGSDALVFDQMAMDAHGLCRIDDDGMLYLPGLPQYGAKRVCRVIFRPLAWKTT
jgi:hypothetical protein